MKDYYASSGSKIKELQHLNRNHKWNRYQKKKLSQQTGDEEINSLKSYQNYLKWT